MRKSFSNIMQFLLVMSMLTLALRIQSAKSSPITITVPDDYPTVQGAINGASPGCTVYVKAGAYVENIVLNKTVALIGEDKDTTIIDGNASGDCVHITADNTVLENFTVRNGGARPGTAYSSVRLSSNKNNITSNNLVGSWCGVGIDDGCEGNVISQNYISGNLNGISGELWYNSEIIGNDITDNLMGMWIGPYTSHNTVSFNNIEKSRMEGIYAYAPSYSTFEGNNLIDNNLGGFRAGLTIALQLPFSFGNKFFHNNFADYGKQIEVYDFQGPQLIVWDDGYPSGGNYWRDYNGTDICSGPFQNLTGSDGIGDTPYIISTSSVDRHPFVNHVPCHDVAVVDVTPYRSWVYEGWLASINATVTNVGNFTEDAIVALYYNITASEIVGTQNVTLAPGQSQTIIFTWNTTGVPYCLNYTMTAVASIPNDNYPADNTLAGGTIKVRILGDINGDDKVDMRDISNAAKAFGSYLGEPGWSPDADVNRDGNMDLRDVAIVAKHFGQYP